MNVEDFREEVMASLGGNIVDVYLEDKDIDRAFRRAKKTFQQKGNDNFRKGYFRLPVNNCQMTYQLPSEISVVVQIIRPTMTFNAQDEFSLVAYNQLFGWNSTSGDIMGDWLSYEMTLQLHELWQRYMAFEIDFQHDEFRNTISMEKKPSRKNEIWLLECYHHLQDEEYREVLWIQDWTIAECKVMLGQAYRMIPQLPGPEGPVNIDGNGMIQEGKDEMRTLLEDIQAGVDGAPEAWGIVVG